MPRASNREYVIRREDQLKALTSPERRRVLEALEGLGRATVKDLAQHVGRLPASLYYHVRKLSSVGLVAEVDQRGSGRRAEAVYALVAPVLRVDSEGRSEDWLAGLERVAAASMRRAARLHARALRDPTVVKRGTRRQLRAQQTTARLSQAGLERLNRKLREIDELLQSEQRAAKKGRFYSFTCVLAPVEPGRGPA